MVRYENKQTHEFENTGPSLCVVFVDLYERTSMSHTGSGVGVGVGSMEGMVDMEGGNEGLLDSDGFIEGVIDSDGSTDGTSDGEKVKERDMDIFCLDL